MVYTGEVMGVASGGLRRDATYLDNLDLKLHLDAARLVRWPGAMLFAYVLGNHGGVPSDLVGDLQGVSNIAAPEAWRLYELWLQQNLADGKFSLLAGLYDINSEFDVLQSAGLFLNGSHGMGAEFGASGRNGPSIFPTTSLGLRIKYRPRPGFYAGVVVLDGVPGDLRDPKSNRVTLAGGDGVLVIAEAALLPGAAERPPPIASRVGGRNRGRRIGRGQNLVRYDGKIAVGAWRYTGVFADVDAIPPGGSPRFRRGSYGAYLLAEHKLIRGPDEDRGASGFVRIGIAHPDVNPIAGYGGAGITWTGAFDARPEDEMGLAVAVAAPGTPFRRASAAAGRPLGPRETSLEASYRVQLRPAFALQPDIQWIHRPGADASVRDALVFGLRVEAALKWQ